jgi:hypothetical protein
MIDKCPQLAGQLDEILTRLTARDAAGGEEGRARTKLNEN